MAKGRPTIGIAADLLLRRGGYPLAGIDVGFADQVASAGGVPVVLPAVADVRSAIGASVVAQTIERIEGLILVGGGDFSREYATGGKSPHCRPVLPRREQSDRALLGLALANGLPVLAVGSGMHLLNLAFGGTLYHCIAQEMARALPHQDGFDPAHRHRVSITPDTRLERIYGEGDINVNSCHLQGVRRVGHGLRSSALAPDGLVEAVEGSDEKRFVVGVQWHPESTSRSALDLQLFQALVKAAKTDHSPPAGDLGGGKEFNG